MTRDELLERIVRLLWWAYDQAMHPGPPDPEKAEEIRQLLRDIGGL